MSEIVLSGREKVEGREVKRRCPRARSGPDGYLSEDPAVEFSGLRSAEIHDSA